MIGTVSAGLAHSLLMFAVGRGLDRETLLQKAGIAAPLLVNPDNRVPMDSYRALMRAAKDMSGDPALAIEFGASEPIEKHSVVGLICHSAATMGEAFMQMSRYARLVIDVESGTDKPRFTLAQLDSGVWIEDNRPEPNAFPELSESTFARFVCDYRRHFGDAPFAKEIHVTHARPAHADAYDRTYRVPVHYGMDRNAIRIDPTWLSVEIQPTNRYMFGVLSKMADALMKKLEGASSIRGRVENMLLPLLHTGEVSMDDIAAKLNMSRQTLYRKLRAEGVSFEAILDELRHTMALHYLDGQQVSVNETAYLVGFSEASSFSRAFKRWTGQNPSDHRARQNVA